MFPEYRIIQIIEIPTNGKSTPYAVREYGRMEYFQFDFLCKNSIKKFFAENELQSGEYIVISDNEHSGDRYVTEAVITYRTKDSGNFVDFKLPGEKWVQLVKDVLEQSPVIDMGLTIQTMNKVTIPKLQNEPESKEE